jgi:hypothetical protein
VTIPAPAVRRLGLLTVVAGCLASPPVRSAEPTPRSIADLARALDQAVRSVSRPSATSVFGPAQATRGYRVPGVGVLFVVPPRRLPREVPQQPGRLTSRPGPHSAGTPDPEMERALRAYEEQALAMHEAAAQSQREAEQVLTQMVRVMEGDAAGRAVMPAFPPPPWLEWVSQDYGRDSRPPEDVIADVRRGIIEVLGSRVPEALDEEEGIITVVEFHSDEIVHPEAPAAHTLTIQVSGKDLG